MNSDTAFGSFPVSLQEQELLAAVKIRPGLKVLNLGTGAVFRTLELAQRLGPQSSVQGVLKDAGLLEFYNEYIRNIGVNNIALIQTTKEELPFADHFFDLLILHCSYRDMRHFNNTLREAARVSGPGAQFLLCILIKDSLQEYFSLVQEALHNLNLHAATDAWHTLKESRLRSLKDVEIILKDAGLTNHTPSKCPLMCWNALQLHVFEYSSSLLKEDKYCYQPRFRTYDKLKACIM
jgi:ubiquinone/menaquinone biosynthesis C-methylase UbiE